MTSNLPSPVEPYQMTPIAIAVLPLREEAIQRAEKVARAQVEIATRELAANNSDLKLVAPYPSGNLGRADYMYKLSLRKWYESLTTCRETVSYSRTAPEFVDINPAKVERFVQSAREDAALQYDLFIAKLNQKVGEHIGATLEGNHVWGHSVLNVVKEDGTRENWKTQMIINRSSLGTVFNQFPTRKVKGTK